MKAAIIDSLTCIDLKDQKLSVNEVLTYFQNLSEHHDSEIKLYTSDIKNYTTSFNWTGINQWKVDCPVKLNEIHSQCYATTEECTLLIKKLYQYGDLDREQRFIDVPISHFTLDEMLQFKKEDTMMLRGQDPDKPAATIKNTAPKPLQQLESTLSKETAPNKVKSIAETVLKKEPKPSRDSSFFSI